VADISLGKGFVHEMSLHRSKNALASWLMQGQIICLRSVIFMDMPSARKHLADFRKGDIPLVCLTAYTAPMARLLDPYVDLLLVGDSMGMVEYGFDGTRPVTLDMMIPHGAAVVRATRHALVVIDLPFGTYETSSAQALASAQRAMKETGSNAVKLEGGQEMAATIRHLVQNGIPVMGHIGLLPQSVTEAKGFKIQGRDDEGARKLIEDAKAVAAAGAFSIVIEGTIESVARAITESVSIPTIGIGASPACDGQILVINDVLGFTERPPKFAKRYAEIGPVIADAVKNYAADVRGRRFPSPEYTYGSNKKGEAK
jgi:3-methyl-2-oxobutanoate hydroxymethyltransferase